MIFGSIENNKDFEFYPKAVKKALKYIEENDLSLLEPGEYEIEGRNLYFQIQEFTTECIQNRLAETHDIYVDLQYLIEGRERIGYAVCTSAEVVKEDLRPEMDLVFYENPDNETMLSMIPGSFAVFFPSDIHRPGCEYSEPMKVKKAVFKIKYDEM